MAVETIQVDLKILYPQPWSLERQDVLFSQLLDAIRYLVVWQPAIICLVKGKFVFAVFYYY
jgi:hypothetical protein